MMAPADETRARIRHELQALAVDFATPAVQAFLDRLDRLFAIEEALHTAWLGGDQRLRHDSDPPCVLAHVAESGGTVGALEYLTGAGANLEEMRRRLAELAPHLGLELGAPASDGDAEAWLRRQIEGLGSEGGA
jgi:hypothetical protein